MITPMIGVRILQTGSTWFCAAERRFGSIARRHWLCVALVGFLGATGSAIVSLLSGVPEPRIHDEFSYLLAADTFAHGRLTNPQHPLWIHFESMHIIQQPTYASKYPPAQGLLLAAGQVIGHPIIGVWIGEGLMCSAICWMLLGWLPSRWAALGGLLVVMNPGVGMAGYWSQSYWGGTVAAIGGGLVFGALRRVMQRPDWRHALLMGLGLAVLANSRPYEGFLACLPVGVVLLAWMVSRSGPVAQVSLGRVVLPIIVILAFTGAAMAYYNRRVTGSALRMPYSVHEATYSIVPSFLWRPPRPEPNYRHDVLRSFHKRWAYGRYIEQLSIRGFVRTKRRALGKFWRHYVGLLTAFLVALPWMLKDRWVRLALLTCGLSVAGSLVTTSWRPHYSAPITGLIFVLALQGAQQLDRWRWRERPAGRLAIGIVLCTYIAVLALSLTRHETGNDVFASSLSRQGEDGDTFGWSLRRARLLEQLRQDGRYHLVIVRYGAQHSPQNEWVYNEGDIDRAKVVWARAMNSAQNRNLVEYFKDRCVWLLEVDGDSSPPKLKPYSNDQLYIRGLAGFE